MKNKLACLLIILVDENRFAWLNLRPFYLLIVTIEISHVHNFNSSFVVALHNQLYLARIIRTVVICKCWNNVRFTHISARTLRRSSVVWAAYHSVKQHAASLKLEYCPIPRTELERVNIKLLNYIID